MGDHSGRVARRIGVRGSTAVFLGTFGLLLALGLVRREFTQYQGLLEIPDQASVVLVVHLALVAKTIAAMTVGLVLAVLLASSGGSLLSRLLGVAWVVAVAAWLSLDLQIQQWTGNHLSDYLDYLKEPDALHWAGGGVAAGPLLRAGAGWLTGVLLALVAAAAFERWVRPGGVARRVAAAAPLAGWAFLLGAGAVGGRTLDASVIPLPARAPAQSRVLFAQLEETMPWSWQMGASPHAPDATQAKVQALYARYRSHVHEVRTSVPPDPRWTPERTPNVIVIALDSLRHDALTPEVMPELWEFSNRGVRSESHYASANGSHYGLFALLYGRFPLDYFEALDAGVPPTLPTLLRAAGYRAHCLASSQLDWIGMEQFLGPPYWEVAVHAEGPNWQRDAATLEAARRIMAEDPARPSLLFVFLMSTHLDYEYPPGHELFRPAAPPPDWTQPVLPAQREGLLNRYRNSAHFADSLLGAWLRELDLEHNLVIVTGDHGESIFDDGILAHSSRLSEIQTRVPFVVAGPGVPAGLVLTGTTSHVDVVPTVLARLDFPSGEIGLPGVDLLGGAPSPPYAAVFMVHRPEHANRELALVGERGSFGLRLLRKEEEMRFLGPLGDDGRPSQRPVSEEEAQVFLEWFHDYLRRSLLGLPAS